MYNYFYSDVTEIYGLKFEYKNELTEISIPPPLHHGAKNFVAGIRW
jgi:hypothetical protein